MHQILIGVQHHFERLRSDWLPSSHYQVGRFCIISDGVFKLGVTDHSKSFLRQSFCIAFPLKVMAFNLVTDYSKSFTNCHITRGRLVVDVTDIANPSQIVCQSVQTAEVAILHLFYRIWPTADCETLLVMNAIILKTGRLRHSFNPFVWEDFPTLRLNGFVKQTNRSDLLEMKSIGEFPSEERNQ